MSAALPITTPRPRWLADLARTLPIRSQFIVSGNIRDSCLASVGGAPALVPLLRALWETLRPMGFECLLVYDPADGIRAYPDQPAQRELAEKLFNLKLSQGPQIISLESLTQLMRQLSSERSARCALVMDFASRLTRQPSTLSEAEHRFFVVAEKLSLQAAPVVVSSDVPKPVDALAGPLFNPVIWLLNRAQDLPSWLTLDSERVASLVVPRPDYEMRMAAAEQLAPLFAGFSTAEPPARQRFLSAFADSTEGMTLSALADITQLANCQRLGVADIEDAVRCFKVGALDTPWKSAYLRDKVRGAQAVIEDRVKGQHAAVVKTLDILKRSIIGLTGAQARSGDNRPRGVLFFAGPTGVGKTELAKTLTQVLFGNERAYLRYDMSEFAEEHTGARLQGAPPAYIGFDAGGALTNAVREKPFSGGGFDEIVKAHPRILDKFLQILEDGRLTDGRGETTYFSETVLVFTSNLGIYVEDADGRRVQNVKPGDDYEAVEARVRGAIGDYFKYRLSRPEILNRIGDNIVVFDFISPEVGELIFDGKLRNAARRLRDELKLRRVKAPEVRQALLARCTQDLSHGGRGIGNVLESAFINPLSRALFEQPLEGRQTLAVTGLREADKVVDLTLQLS